MLTKKRVYWFTGLSGAGKTTIVEMLREKISALNINLQIVDSDVLRATFNKNLSFSREDILLNNKLIAEYYVGLLEKNDVLLVPVISPFDEGRQIARQIIGENIFRLVYFSANLQTVAKRDVKSLYKKAFAGEIKNMIGVCEKTPYQKPDFFDFEIDSGAGEPAEMSVQKLEKFILKDLE